MENTVISHGCFVLSMGGLVVAFKNYKISRGIFGSDWAGFDNFKFFFQSEDARRVIVNTLTYNFLFIVVGMAASITIAVFLSAVTKNLF